MIKTKQKQNHKKKKEKGEDRENFSPKKKKICISYLQNLESSQADSIFKIVGVNE